MIYICAVLSFVIPFAVYRINRRWHRYGDPPWKKEREDDSGGK